RCLHILRTVACAPPCSIVSGFGRNRKWSGVMPAFAGMTMLPPHGGLEAGGFGFALGAEPALPARLLDAAAVVVGRSGQHVDAGPAGHQALDRAAVGRAALGFVPGLGAELGGALHLAGRPDTGLGVARLP